MIKRQLLNSINVCIKHNNKNIKINNTKLEQKILRRNYSIFKKNKMIAFYNLKKKNLISQLLKNV